MKSRNQNFQKSLLDSIFYSLDSGKRGQLLIEAMVAISIIVVGLFGVLNLLSTSLGLNKVIADQYKAAYLASEGIEIIRNIVDENIARGLVWNDTVSSVCDDGCEAEYNSSKSDLRSYTGAKLTFQDGKYTYENTGVQTSFTRLITAEMIGDGSGPPTCHMKVTSRVDWTTRGAGQFNIQLEDRFYNWRSSSC